MTDPTQKLSLHLWPKIPKHCRKLGKIKLCSFFSFCSFFYSFSVPDDWINYLLFHCVWPHMTQIQGSFRISAYICITTTHLHFTNLRTSSPTCRLRLKRLNVSNSCRQKLLWSRIDFFFVYEKIKLRLLWRRKLADT